MVLFSKTSSSSRMSSQNVVSKNVKIGKNGQKAMDVFFKTSEPSEMSTLTNELDGSWIQHTIDCPDLIPTRSFVCVKCGAENVEVPCPANVKKCAQCGNTKRNIDLGDDIYDNQSPDYFNNSADLETEDQRFNFKEFVKFKTEKHAERLGTLEGAQEIGFAPSTRPCDFVPAVNRSPCVHSWNMEFVPTKKIKGTRPMEALVKDKLVLKCVDEQIKVIPADQGEMANMIKNIMRRSMRIVEMLTSDIPSETFKDVQINTWKARLRENADILKMINYEFDPEHPPLSPKQFGNWTWHLRSCDTVEKKLMHFMSLVPRHAQVDMGMIKEFNLEKLGIVDEQGRSIKTEIILTDPSYIPVKKTVFGNQVTIWTDPSIAETARKDWLALRSTIAIEPWHDEMKRPKFSYQAYVFKVARLVSKDRVYVNPRTPEYERVLEEEAYIKTRDEPVANSYDIYKKVQQNKGVSV